MFEVFRPGLQPLCQSYEEDDDEKQGEKAEGLPGKYHTQDQIGHMLRSTFEFLILLIRKSQMGIGVTGKTSMSVNQQDILKQNLAPILLVDQGLRVR